MDSTTRDGTGNTRLKPRSIFEIHSDYLRIRKDAVSHEEFEMLVGFIVPDFTLKFDSPWSPGAGAVYFPHKVIGTHGVVGGFNVDEEGFFYTMIDMPGGYFHSKTAIDQWRLFQGLFYKYKVTCTRIDLAIDDPTYSQIPVAEMEKACAEGFNFGFRNYGKHASGQCGKDLDETLALGSRNSGKYGRIYDHDGECLRHEVEFKRGFAQPVFEKIATMDRDSYDRDGSDVYLSDERLFSSSDNWDINVQKTMASIVLGAFDFRDRGTRKEASRAGIRDSKRLDFYQQYIDTFETNEYRVRLTKPAKTIEKTLEWIKRQCAPTLAMISEAFGRHHFNLWMREIVVNGIPRLDNQKMFWVKEIERNKKLYVPI